MRRAARGPLTLAPVVLGPLLAGLLLLVPAAGPALAAGTPAPTASSSASSTPTTPSPSGSPEAPAPSPSATTAALHPVDAGGVLFVSGVRSTYEASPDPFGGTLHVELTVRNAYTKVVDASASLAARNLLGMDLGGSSSLAVRDIRPGEIRVVHADIPGVGQWGVFHVHATLSPPAEVSGVKLAPLDRDRWVVATPWYLLALVLALGTLVWVLVRYRLVPGARRPTVHAPPPGGPAVRP